jgi:SAM-dependent methyltransferase
MNKAFESSAELYDLLYGDKDYSAEAEFVEKQFGADHTKTLKILEIGCGTGNYLKAFLDKGYDISGVDISEEMLNVARKKCDCELYQGDMRDFKIVDTKFDVIMIMFDVLSYVTDNDGIEKTLKNVREHLNENGKLIFLVWNGLAVLSNPRGEGVREVEREGVKVVRSFKPVLKAESHVVESHFKYWMIDKESGKVRESIEVHPMRFFFPQEIRYFLETNGFEVEVMSDFMDVDKPVDENASGLFCVARRKG